MFSIFFPFVYINLFLRFVQLAADIHTSINVEVTLQKFHGITFFKNEIPFDGPENWIFHVMPIRWYKNEQENHSHSMPLTLSALLSNDIWDQDWGLFKGFFCECTYKLIHHAVELFFSAYTNKVIPSRYFQTFVIWSSDCWLVRKNRRNSFFCYKKWLCSSCEIRLIEQGKWM